MAVSTTDTCQWLAVTEETLFLHDGLLRVTDLVELPQDIENVGGSENEVVSFDSKKPDDLSAKLLIVCGTHNNAFNKLLEYRLNALKGLWKTQRQIAKEEQIEKESPSSHEETIILLKKQGLLKDPEQASFSTRISILLILPLLQSQSKSDPELCGVTAGVLLNCLKDCAPLSLSKEPSDCLKGLESLLCSWLDQTTEDAKDGMVKVRDKIQRENAASALVALACARGHLQTFIHTVHLLQGLSDLHLLPVADILQRLLETEGGQGQLSSVLGSKHLISWAFEDQLSSTTAGTDSALKETKEVSDKDKEKDGEFGRSLTTDGSYLFISTSTGPGMAKIGTGLHGTLRGYVYTKNFDILPGHVAYGNHLLLMRPVVYDQESNHNSFCQLLDSRSLKIIKVLSKPQWLLENGICTTLAFCSDGAYFYWIWCPALVSDKSAKGIGVFVDSFSIDATNLEILPKRNRITLTRKEDTGNHRPNETLINRLRPLRGSSSAATLAALIAGEPPAKKEENVAVGGTSCGVLLKTLVKAPIYCDGTNVVILVPLAGGGVGTSARSLFGTGGSISSLRSLASNLCFSLIDGTFNTRTDLNDAPTCSLARGTSVNGIGACFDVHNNMIWLCSSDYIDQFYNPGHQAPHHIHSQLGIQKPVLSSSEAGELVTMREVVGALLQHIGSMCLHQLHSDVLQLPMGSYVLQQHPVDLAHLVRISTVLRRALDAHDTQSAVCCLVVLQLIFKVSMFKWDRDGEEEQIKETRSLIWKILTNKDFVSSEKESEVINLPILQLEACRVVTVGLKSLYHSRQDKHTLLLHLLTSADDNAALLVLRDMILTSFAEQLRTQCISTPETAYLRFCLIATLMMCQLNYSWSSLICKQMTC